MIIILDYFLNRVSYKEGSYKECDVNWGSVVGVIAGAAVGNLVPFGISGINAMIIAAICYCVYRRLNKRRVTVITQTKIAV